MGRMLSWIAIGGFRLQVSKEDADAALKLLSAPQSASSEDDAADDQARG